MSDAIASQIAAITRVMPYAFHGFFARPLIAPPNNLPPGFEWRPVHSPFLGVGIRIVTPNELCRAPADVQQVVQQLGFHSCTAWIYLDYECFGGRLDFVYGFGVSDSSPFGPIREDEVEKTVTAYENLMSHFGLSSPDAFNFAPFRRGFWKNA